MLLNAAAAILTALLILSYAAVTSAMLLNAAAAILTALLILSYAAVTSAMFYHKMLLIILV